ncbi:unnamed protein product [Aphanomyces euteiches]
MDELTSASRITLGVGESFSTTDMANVAQIAGVSGGVVALLLLLGVFLCCCRSRSVPSLSYPSAEPQFDTTTAPYRPTSYRFQDTSEFDARYEPHLPAHQNTTGGGSSNDDAAKKYLVELLPHGFPHESRYLAPLSVDPQPDIPTAPYKPTRYRIKETYAYRPQETSTTYAPDLLARQSTPTGGSDEDAAKKYIEELLKRAFQSQLYDVYDALSPARKRIERPFAPSVEYVVETYEALTPTKPSNSRSLAAFEGRRDQVHFTAYGPAVVMPFQEFSFDIWAYLVNQRDEMHDRAIHEQDGATQITREALMGVRRGAKVSITLEVPESFRTRSSPTQTIEWHGQVTSAKFLLQCNQYWPRQTIVTATIVVGSSISVLRSYVTVAVDRRRMEYTELESTFEQLPLSYREVPFSDIHMKELVDFGHVGDVYRADLDGKEVVVKTIRAQAFGDGLTDQIVKEFQHEAAVLNMFGHHPNTTSFHLSTLALITEYLPYGNVEQQRRSLSRRPKMTILHGAAQALANMHEGRFIHRDIAARNCLVDINSYGSVQAKLCDFGLSRRVASTGTQWMKRGGVGPLKYMAPESLQSPYSFSYKSDAYSFGVFMWETFSNTPPFPSMAPAEAAAYVLEGGRLDISECEAIPPPMADIMIQWFQEDPSRRPTLFWIEQQLSTHVRTRR